MARVAAGGVAGHAAPHAETPAPNLVTEAGLRGGAGAGAGAASADTGRRAKSATRRTTVTSSIPRGETLRVGLHNCICLQVRAGRRPWRARCTNDKPLNQRLLSTLRPLFTVIGLTGTRSSGRAMHWNINLLQPGSCVLEQAQHGLLN
jgi:hypothetical protein